MSVSLVGAGMISSVHAMAAAQIGQSVASFSARSAESANSKAQQFGGEAHALPLVGAADAYVVCTTAESHATYALPLLQSGRRTLVEKPLCATLDEADQLVAFGDTGVYGENLLSAPAITQLLDRSQSIGQFNYVEIRLLSPFPQWGDYGNAQRGGGVFFDLGSQAVALALTLAQSPIAVLRSEFSFNNYDVETHAVVSARCQNGTQFRLETSWQHHSQLWDVQVSSAQSVVRAELLPQASLEQNGEPIALAIHEQNAAHLFDLGYVEQMNRLFTQPAALPPLSFGRRVLQTICAAYVSAGTGKEIALPYSGPQNLTPIELFRAAKDGSL